MYPSKSGQFWQLPDSTAYEQERFKFKKPLRANFEVYRMHESHIQGCLR